MSKGRQFAIHVTERVSAGGRFEQNKGVPNWGLALLSLICLAWGLPGLFVAWPEAVAALRHSSRLVKANATITDTRIVEVRHPDQVELKSWRKEGLCEFKAARVSRHHWVTLAVYHKRSEVVPGGAGEHIAVWYNPEKDETTIYLPNPASRWFLLMFYMVLSLSGFSSALILGQRLVQRERPEQPTL